MFFYRRDLSVLPSYFSRENITFAATPFVSKPFVRGQGMHENSVVLFGGHGGVGYVRKALHYIDLKYRYDSVIV